jgi:glycosyltransferase involved in cell wall biosynthesis
MVKLGMLARAEDRGLGIMLWEFARHMRPDRTLVVDMGELGRGFPMHLDRYDEPTVTAFDGQRFTDETTVKAWLAGLDVVYVAETWYDERFPDWCHDLGVRCVLHVMPEFWRWGHRHMPAVVTWAPTSWRLSTLPPRTQIVPVPVPLDRWPMPVVSDGGPLRVLHVAGKRAAGDRNGTTLFAAALARTSAPMRVTVSTQDDRLPRLGRDLAGLDVETRIGGVGNYWEQYADHDLLVMPRRYGGLSLPVNEAAGAGLGLVLSACRPNVHEWPCEAVKVDARGAMATPAGTIPSHAVSTPALARLLNDLARDPERVAGLARAARRWAVSRSWTEMLHEYRCALEAACE